MAFVSSKVLPIIVPKIINKPIFCVVSLIMNLVIVESPAKAKTINKYLGEDYTVLASYGHIRDLPSKNGSVDPEDKFKMIWEVDSFSKKYLKEITDVAKKSKKIILATDPDREGEAIAWHVKEIGRAHV